MPKNKSMKYQVKKSLYDQKRFGQSKHEAKINENLPEGIFSYQTMEDYVRSCTQFADWCKNIHGVKTLEECKEYAQEYIDSREDLSAYTLKLDVSAINKLYKENIVSCEKSRNRGEIRRSRGYTEQSIRAEKRNGDIVRFCKACGLRRHEVEALRQCDIKIANNKVIVNVIQGKGGKHRCVEVLRSEEEFVKKYMADSTDKVFEKVDRKLDIHKYRRSYANSLYNQKLSERIVNKDNHNLYRCRGDKKGIVYYRDVMKEVTLNLGHNRINVIAGHYLD